MRNYISAVFWRWQYHGEQSGGSSFDDFGDAFGTSKTIQRRFDEYMQSIRDDFPDYVITTQPPAVSTVYVQLDSFNVLTFLNYLADLFGVFLTQSNPPKEITNIFVIKTGDYTPRNGWKDGASVRHKPPPSESKRPAADFSGSSGLFAAAQGLLAYSKALADSGRLRDAGIVKFAYDRIFDLQMTITEAFDYLRKNHLV